MATLIPVEGPPVSVEARDSDHGFTLAEVYELLGCDLVEVVRLPAGRLLLIDEMGKLRPAPQVNERATNIGRWGGLAASDVIVGPALICFDREFQ
jgi:hypothetical protein